MSLLKFEASHKMWVDYHANRRSGERKRRLLEGHDHAEKEMLRHIWWPAFGDFNHLHPEYEVTDYFGGPRYLDFAYIREPYRIAIEVDGYGPHVRDLSRRQFCDQWVRQMHLVNDGWIVVRIGYDDVLSRPRLWQQLLQQMIGRLYGRTERPDDTTGPEDRELIRHAIGLGRPIKLRDVEAVLRCKYRYARSAIRRLTQDGWLVPAGGGTERIHAWRVNMERAAQLPW